MADGVISERIVLDYAQALTAAKQLATESHELADAQRQVAAAAKAAESGLRRLEDLAASTEAERAALAYRRQATEIEALGRATGNQALAERALARLNAEAAERLTVSTAATTRLASAHGVATAAADRSAVSHGALAAGMTNLGNQAADVAVQLAGGASPALVLMQQGPQIAAAAASMGGLGTTMSALGTAAAAAAPLLAAAGLAVSGLVAGYAVWKNATTDAASETRDANQALIDQAVAAPRAADAVKRLADEWTAYLSLSSDIQTELDKINGLITEGESATQRKIARLDAAAESNLRAQGQDVGKLLSALQAAQALSVDQSADAATRANASAQIAGLEEQLAKAQARLDATKAQLAADKEKVKTEGEYADALKQSETFLKDRADALEAARKAAEAAEAARAAMWRGLQEEIAGADKARAAVLALADAERALALSRGQMGEAAYQRAGTAARMDQLQALQPVQVNSGLSLSQATAANLAAQRGEVEASAFTKAWGKKVVAEAAAGMRGWMDATRGGAGGVVDKLAGMSGPVGWIASISQLVKSIGDGLLEGVHEWVMELIGTVGNLPTILADAIETFLSEGIPALFEMVPDLIESLAEALPRIITALITDMVQSIPRIIALLTKTLPAAFEALLRSLADYIKSIFTLDFWADAGIKIADGFIKGVGDKLGDLVLGKNREGLLSDLWRGPQGEGGVSNLFGLLNSRQAADGAASPASTARTASAASRERSRGGVTVNAGFVFGGRAGLRELSDAIVTDQSISRYGWA